MSFRDGSEMGSSLLEQGFCREPVAAKEKGTLLVEFSHHRDSLPYSLDAKSCSQHQPKCAATLNPKPYRKDCCGVYNIVDRNRRIKPVYSVF